MIVGRPSENIAVDGGDLSALPLAIEPAEPHYPQIRVEEISKRIDDIMIF